MIDDKFVIKYTPYILSQLRAMKVIQYYGNETTVDDICSEVWEKAMERQDRYDPSRGSVEVWLRFLVRDVVSELKRKTVDAMKHIAKSLDCSDDWADLDDEKGITGHDILAEEEHLFADTRRFYFDNKDLVDYYINLITDARVQSVVRLRLIDGRAHEEIADAMNISEENSRIIYYRGLQELKAAIRNG